MPLKEDNYIVDLAKNALRSVRSLETFRPADLMNEPERKNPLKIGGFYGAGMGLGLGILLLIGGYFLGISFGNVESVVIVGQFSLIGGLMTYINS